MFFGFNGHGQVSGTPPGSDFIAIAAGGYHGVAVTEAPPPDTAAPVIEFTAPAEGANYAFQETVELDYSCVDDEGGSGIRSCAGDLADGASLDTSTAGVKTFTVRAEDNAGNVATKTVHYRIIDSIPPMIVIGGPCEGAATQSASFGGRSTGARTSWGSGLWSYLVRPT